MIRLELTDQDLSDTAEALDDPANSEKNKTKLLVIRMHHEGARHGFIAKVLNLHSNTVTNHLKEYFKGGLAGTLEDRYYRPTSSLEPFLACLKCSFLAAPVADAKEVGAQINLRFDARIGPRCPHCQSKLPRNKTSQCAVMDLPIADGPVVYICFPTVQGRCEKCLHFVTTRPIEIHPTRGATWRLMRMIRAWAAHAPATQIAAIHEISDSTVRHYDKEVLKADLPPPDLDHLRILLVDEKAVRRDHNYVTIVLNGDTGEFLYIAEGKKREVLDRFFEPLSPEQKSSIEAVGIDRSGAYQSSIQENLPGAAIVYDRFHLMMNLNQAVDQVRRQR